MVAFTLERIGGDKACMVLIGLTRVQKHLGGLIFLRDKHLKLSGQGIQILSCHKSKYRIVSMVGVLLE